MSEITKTNSLDRAKSGNKKPHYGRKLEEVQQLLEQAKVSGDKFGQKVWQAVLDKLKNKPH